MQFVYPANLSRTTPGEIAVSFRDLPECLTSGADTAEALTEAADTLAEALAGRIDDGDPIPAPSPNRPGERGVPVPPGMAAKAALAIAFRESGLTSVAFAASSAMHNRRQSREKTACAGIANALRGFRRETDEVRGHEDGDARPGLADVEPINHERLRVGRQGVEQP